MITYIISGIVAWSFIRYAKKKGFLLRLFISKKKKQALHEFFARSFSYYNLLSPTEQNKFVLRVNTFRQLKQLEISPEIRNSSTDVELLICAALTQITFGYFDFELDAFARIIIRPGSFYSKLVNNEVKGLTLGNGIVYYSWEDFLKGYIFENDKVNLALHELAHALYIDRFHGVEDENWEMWKYYAEIEVTRLKTAASPFFRSYGKTSVDEFWAVCVECFFEDPLTFRRDYSQLYFATARLLKQDMAGRLTQTSIVAVTPATNSSSTAD